jgi:hypothetical protein
MFTSHTGTLYDRRAGRSGGDSLTSKDMRFFMVKALAKWRLQYADA